jgi:hypothetical protein
MEKRGQGARAGALLLLLFLAAAAAPAAARAPHLRVTPPSSTLGAFNGSVVRTPAGPLTNGDRFQLACQPLPGRERPRTRAGGRVGWWGAQGAPLVPPTARGPLNRPAVPNGCAASPRGWPHVGARSQTPDPDACPPSPPPSAPASAPPPLKRVPPSPAQQLAQLRAGCADQPPLLREAAGARGSGAAAKRRAPQPPKRPLTAGGGRAGCRLRCKTPSNGFLRRVEGDPNRPTARGLHA